MLGTTRDRLISLPQDTALLAMRLTHPIGRQRHGESVAVAFHRLVGRPMTETLLSSACWWDGRFLSVNLYRGGYAVVHDPLQGWEIRSLPKERRGTEVAVNMAGAAARKQRWSLFQPKARRASGAGTTYWHQQDSILQSVGEWQR